MGYLGVKAIVATLKGEPVEKFVDTGVTIATAENLADPQIQAVLGQ